MRTTKVLGLGSALQLYFCRYCSVPVFWALDAPFTQLRVSVRPVHAPSPWGLNQQEVLQGENVSDGEIDVLRTGRARLSGRMNIQMDLLRVGGGVVVFSLLSPAAMTGDHVTASLLAEYLMI